MSAPISSLLTFITLFSLISLSSPSSPSPITLQRASEVLRNSNFASMALTLELISQIPISSILPPSPSFTIFAPRDSAFAASGQPSLSLLQFHFSPLPLSPHYLSSLPFASQIPTASGNLSLTISTLPNDTYVSINGLRIDPLVPLYVDSSLIIFGIDRFFDKNYTLPKLAPSLRPVLGCMSLIRSGNMDVVVSNSLDRAFKVMKSAGYSVFGSLLSMQLLGFHSRPNSSLTVFAPDDEAMARNFESFSEYPSVFLQHTVPCKLLIADLNGLGRGTIDIPTYHKGFEIHVKRSRNTSTVNGITVVAPEMYRSDWVVVHGIDGILGKKTVGAPQPQVSHKENSYFGFTTVYMPVFVTMLLGFLQ